MITYCIVAVTVFLFRSMLHFCACVFAKLLPSYME